jgi:hypothetical protein
MKPKAITKFFVATTLVTLVFQAADGRANAPTGHYATVNATVRDTKTGLTWQQTTTGGGTYTWDAAKTFCSGLGSGWRLPTAKELLTLVDAQAYHAEATTTVIDNAAFPATSVDVDWWSSTTVASASSQAWAVNFAVGDLEVADKTAELHARCVK